MKEKSPIKPQDPKYTTFSPERIAQKKYVLTDEKENLNHRVLRLSVEKEALEEMEASLIAQARNQDSASTILSKMKQVGLHHIKVKEISSQKFLINFKSRRRKQKWIIAGLIPGFALSKM